jgi:hypothetical protein
MKQQLGCLIAGVGLLLCGATQAQVAEEVIQESFFPYANWTPTFEGYEPGVTITAENADQYQAILDDFTYRYIKQGWYEMRTAPTSSFPLHENYIQSTRDNAHNNTLSGEGILQNFIAGRPFPQEPDASDPEAGTKLMWNFQRSINAGDSETIHPFYWTFKGLQKGNVERQIRFEWHFLNWKHRVMFDPKPDIEPNPGQIFRSVYGTVLEPFDLGNTQLLIQRYEDDLKRDDAWLYLGFQRRVRRLASGQITDAFLGSDAMIEDFEGYNGRISDYNWQYVETKNVLLPYYTDRTQQVLDTEPANDADGFQFIKMGGQGGCFPQVTWELRKVHIIDGTPKDKNHPLSKRVVYQDAQTGTLGMVYIFDKKGDPWKWFPICKVHSDAKGGMERNRGTGVAIDDCAVFMDEQANHCTTLQFKSVINAEENPAKIFSVQQMRKKGQ